MCGEMDGPFHGFFSNSWHGHVQENPSTALTRAPSNYQSCQVWMWFVEK